MISCKSRRGGSRRPCCSPRAARAQHGAVRTRKPSPAPPPQRGPAGIQIPGHGPRRASRARTRHTGRRKAQTLNSGLPSKQLLGLDCRNNIYQTPICYRTRTVPHSLREGSLETNYQLQNRTGSQRRGGVCRPLVASMLDEGSLGIFIDCAPSIY